MPYEPSFRDYVRGLIGQTAVTEQMTRMENDMANAKEQIEALSAKVDDLAADVRAGKGELDPEAQAAFAQLAQKVSDLDAEVGDADGSDTVASPDPVEVPVEGGPDAPVDGGPADPNA